MDYLITGASGFLGSSVLSALSDSNTLALGRTCPTSWPTSRFIQADLLDLPRLSQILTRLKPRHILHLAGATPPASPQTLYRTNVLGTSNLLQALQSANLPARVVLAGSAAELGPVPAHLLPSDESTPCRPPSGYALSKWAASYLARSAAPPLEVIAARIFNPIGPGLPASQAFGRFASLLLDPASDPLRLALANLDARRDFIDVRDVARALIALARQGRPAHLYHVGTGLSRPVADGLHLLIRLSARNVLIETHPPTRPAIPSDSRADIHKIRLHTGWTPRIPFEQSLSDLWQHALRHSPSSRHVA